MLLRPTPLFALLLALRCLLAAAPTQAQRADDAGPPPNDPFGRRVVPARAVPGGRYRSHRVFSSHDKDRDLVRLILEVRATDGSVRQFQTWAPGVVKISYFAPERVAKSDSSVSVVQPPQPIKYETACNHGCEAGPPPGVAEKYGPDVCSGVYVRPEKLTFSVNCQTVEIDKRTLAVTISSSFSSQTPNLKEAGPAFRRISQPGPASGSAAPGGTAVRFRLAPGEQLYGTGSRALPLDRRGYRLGSCTTRRTTAPRMASPT